MRAPLAVAAACLAVAACSSSSPAVPAAAHRPASPSPSPTSSATPTPRPVVPARVEAVAAWSPSLPVIHVPAAGPGQGPVTVLVLDQSRVRLVLHAGTVLPRAGLRLPGHAPTLAPSDRSRLVALFNGGFKIAGARGGWQADGRVLVPLVRGAASVVTYADGTTDVGAWGSEVPARGRTVSTVRQNLRLLVDHGRATAVDPRTQAQLEAVWGHTFRHASLVSRSALGVTADGRLVWAAGTRVTVRALADALLAQGAVRALELDINAPLVRGFLVRPGARLVPLVVGQSQGGRYPAAGAVPHCTYLAVPCPRDFFAVELR